MKVRSPTLRINDPVDREAHYCSYRLQQLLPPAAIQYRIERHLLLPGPV